MSGKGKRRSARLLKLEEEKNDGDSGGVCLLDPWQIIRNSISGSSARGKRKRNEEIQVNCVGSHWVLPSSNSLHTCVELFICRLPGSHLPGDLFQQLQGEASCSHQQPLDAPNSSTLCVSLVTSTIAVLPVAVM